MGFYHIEKGRMVEVYAPFNRVNGPASFRSGEHVYTDTVPWKRYAARKESFLDAGQVLDVVAMHNGRDDVDDWPNWARVNVQNGYTVFFEVNDQGERVYGMVRGLLEKV